MSVGAVPFVYYRNRYYHPATGRFISEDPIGWASRQTNAYAYVNGNPVQFADPAGLQWAFPITPPPVPGMGPRTGGGVPPWFNDLVNGITSIKPPANAYDPNGPKAPGRPSAADDFKTPRVVKIGYPIRIQDGEALHGDGKMPMGTSGVRLDRAAGRTAIHIGTYKDRVVSMGTCTPVGNTDPEISQRSL